MTKHRIFHVDGVSVELDRLALQWGDVPSDNGGGVLVESGSLTLHDCTVMHNNAYRGGGIAATGTSSSLSIYDSGITLNTSGESGGGIYCVGTSSQLYIHDSAITSNESGFNGGGIYSLAGTALLDDVDLGANKAQSKGGGIYASPGGSGTLTIEGGSSIHDNQLLNANPAERKGGGLYLDSGSVVMDTVSIANNSATTGVGRYLAAGTSFTFTGVTGGDSLYDEDNP